MNVEATDQGFVSLADRVRDALVANGRLTPEGVVRIIENMRATGNAFGDAALHLGLITQSDLAEAAETARQMPPKGDGVIEGALLKLSGARGLPVKYTGMCKAGPALILAHHPDSPYSERMRALRTELLLLNGNARTGNLIALLSPCQGE